MFAVFGYKKSSSLLYSVLVFVMWATAWAGITPETILYYSFDGTVGSDIPVTLIDGTGNYTAAHIEGTDADSEITYAEPNTPFPGN